MIDIDIDIDICVLVDSGKNSRSQKAREIAIRNFYPRTVVKGDRFVTL